MAAQRPSRSSSCVNQNAKTFKLGGYHPDSADAFPDPESGAELTPGLTLSGGRDAARKFFAKPSAFLNPQTWMAARSFKAVAEDYLTRHCAGFRSLPELKRQLTKYIYFVSGDRLFVDMPGSRLQIPHGLHDGGLSLIDGDSSILGSASQSISGSMFGNEFTPQESQLW